MATITLRDIIDFDTCKTLVEKAKRNGERIVILCPHYSINVQAKVDDHEELNEDWNELSEHIGQGYLEVSQYDDLVCILPSDTDTDNLPDDHWD